MLGKQKKPHPLSDISLDKMNPAQIRLIRSVASVIKSLLETKKESDFFNNSAELMRLSASLIKQSSFSLEDPLHSNQALEYSLDILQDYMANAKVISYDN